MRLRFTFFCSLICTLSFAEPLNWERHFQPLAQQSGQHFLASFSYQKFLKDISLEDVATLENYRQALLQRDLPAEDWLIQLAQTSASKVAVSPSSLHAFQEQIELGALLLKAPQVLGREARSYEIMGDILLEELANLLENALQTGELSKNDSTVKYLIQRLEHLGYIIDLPLSSFEKLWLNACEGRWTYIWSRIQARYLPQFLIGTGIFLALIVWWGSRRWKKRSAEVSPSITISKKTN